MGINLEATRLQVINIASGMLAGNIPLVEGIRALSVLRHDLEDSCDEVFRPIVAIDDETDRFPIGEVRQRWSKDALKKADQELEAYLALARADIIRACEEILRKFSSVN